jgi:hypothetical protein
MSPAPGQAPPPQPVHQQRLSRIRPSAAARTDHAGTAPRLETATPFPSAACLPPSAFAAATARRAVSGGGTQAPSQHSKAWSWQVLIGSHESTLWANKEQTIRASRRRALAKRSFNSPVAERPSEDRASVSTRSMLSPPLPSHSTRRSGLLSARSARCPSPSGSPCPSPTRSVAGLAQEKRAMIDALEIGRSSFSRSRSCG